MNCSQCIVAMNEDAEAPIFHCAHSGISGCARNKGSFNLDFEREVSKGLSFDCEGRDRMEASALEHA